MAEPNLTGVMLIPFPEREAAIRAKYQEFGFSGPTASDRERDHAIGFLLDRLEEARERIAAAAHEPGCAGAHIAAISCADVTRLRAEMEARDKL